MIGVIDAELIDATDRWRPAEVEQLFADFREAALAIDARCELAPARGDSLRLQCRGYSVLRLGVLFSLMAKLENPAGAQVSLSLAARDTYDPRPLGMRTGAAYVAARRATAQAAKRAAGLTYAPAIDGEEGWAAAVQLLDVVLAKITDRQADVLRYALAHPGDDQRAVARAFGITQQAASKHLRAASGRRIEAVITRWAAAHR